MTARSLSELIYYSSVNFNVKTLTLLSCGSYKKIK